MTEELKTFISDISRAAIEVVYELRVPQFSHLIHVHRIIYTSFGNFHLQKDHSYQAEPRITYLEGARDLAVLAAMLESGERKGALVQVKKF